MKQTWTLPDESTKEKIIIEEKARFLSKIKFRLFFGIINYLLITFFIFLIQSLNVNDYAKDILGYSPSNPPQYHDASYLTNIWNFTYPDKQIATINASSEEEFEMLQKEQIANAQKEAQSICFSKAIPYYLGIFAICVIIFFLFIGYYWSIYSSLKTENFYITQAKCVQRECHKYKYFRTYSVVLKYDNLEELQNYDVDSSSYYAAKGDCVLTALSYSPDGDSLDGLYSLN